MPALLPVESLNAAIAEAAAGSDARSRAKLLKEALTL